MGLRSIPGHIAIENLIVDDTLTIVPSSSVGVPFRSAVEADMARRSLVANAQPQLQVPQEYTVNGSTLFVSVFPKPGWSRGGFGVGRHRWTTDDTGLFQISINSFLDQLSVVMRNIRNSQFVAGVRRGRGRIHHT
ncbi:EKC/KEOPS complex subunit LAGE3 [Lemmus lemmus]